MLKLHIIDYSDLDIFSQNFVALIIELLNPRYVQAISCHCD